MQVSLDKTGYTPGRGPALQRAETVVEQVHTLMDVFAAQDEQPNDIKRNQPGKVSLCDHAADREDNPRLTCLVEMMGNLTFDPASYQSYSPKAWREASPPAEFHAVVSTHQGHARVAYTRTEAESRYRLDWTDGDKNEVVVDHARGTLTVLGGEESRLI